MKVTVEVRHPKPFFTNKDPNYYIFRLSDGGIAKGPFLTVGEAVEWLRRWNGRTDVKKIYSLKI